MSILGLAFITYIQVVCMILGVASIITLLLEKAPRTLVILVMS